MKKKFLALVMTLSMVLSLVPMTALATGDNQVDTVAAGETTNAGTNEGSQDSGSPTGGDNAGSGDSADTSEAPGANNKDKGKDSGSENTDETTPGSPSKPEVGGTGTEPTEPETPTEPATPKKAARIGDEEYPTVAAAIAVADDSESIVLLRDVTENIKINKSLTLDLGGYTLTGDGTKTVVAIAGKEIKVTVRNGTITGGKSTNGGGLDIQSGEILLEKCNITENNAANGGAINISGSANVQIKDSEIHDNTATNSGGAIYMASSYAIDGFYNCACEIVDTKLNNNSANFGGALGMGASLYQYNNMHITASFTMSGKSEISSNTAKTPNTT